MHSSAVIFMANKKCHEYAEWNLNLTGNLNLLNGFFANGNEV